MKTPLQGLSPFVLDTHTEANRTDIRDYLRHELAPHLGKHPDGDRIVERILEKSEGVFLFVERFCDDVHSGHFSLDRPEQFPQGLGGIFFQWFQRQFPDLEEFQKDVRPALRAVLAAREPLPVEILRRLFNWRDEELRDFTRILGSLFPISRDDDYDLIKAYHRSLADWIADEANAGPYFVSAKEGHRMLATARFSDLIGGTDHTYTPAASRYWSRSLIHHCCSIPDWAKVVACVGDARIFWTLWLGGYAIGDHAGANALSPALIDKTAQGTELEVEWALAAAFAERARDLQKRAFSYATKHHKGTNTIRTFLRDYYPSEFLEYRDLIYAFVHFAGKAAIFAIAAARRFDDTGQQAKAFLDRFGGIHSYLGYLEKFASTEGWSGALEDAAFEPYQNWEGLREFIKS